LHRIFLQSSRHRENLFKKINLWRFIAPLAVVVSFLTISAMAETPYKAKLLELAGARFQRDSPPISPAEGKLFAAVVDGEDADCWEGPGKRGVIRSDRLSWLCIDPQASALVPSTGISLIGAEIDEELHLEWAKIAFPFRTFDCLFKKSIILQNTHLRALYLRRTSTADLKAEGLVVKDSVFLANGFEAKAKVELTNSRIGGNLNCDAGHFLYSANSIALDASHAKIDGGVSLARGFKAEGTVDFTDAKIGGTLDCDGGQFVSDGRRAALNMKAARVQGSVYLRRALKVTTGLDTDLDYIAEGGVDLSDTTIGGNLMCTDGQFTRENAGQDRVWALNASGAKINNDVSLDGSFRTDDGVALVGTTVGGKLDCSNGHFIATEKSPPSQMKLRELLELKAINAVRCKIQGAVYLSYDFNAVGEVDLGGATIGGDLVCNYGQFSSWPYPEPAVITGEFATALDCSSAKIDGNVSLRGGIIAVGDLNFAAASIGRSFELRSYSYEDDHGKEIRDVPRIMNGILDLRFTKVGTLFNERESWPPIDSLRLQGFVYDRIHPEAPQSAEPHSQNGQLGWLYLQPWNEFSHQPYEQLAAVFRNMGLEDQAKEVLIALNEDQAAQKIPSSAIGDLIWYKVFGSMIGFGYRPWNAFWISLAFIVLGWWLFRLGYRQGLVTPVEDRPFFFEQKDNVEACKHPELYPKFSACVYSLETFVPLLKLDVSKFWQPNANRGNEVSLRELMLKAVVVLLFGKRKQEYWLRRFNWTFKKGPWTTGAWLRTYLWLHIIAGWVFTTLWVVGLTGLVKP
jgi:hypothetical protein